MQTFALSFAKIAEVLRCKPVYDRLIWPTHVEVCFMSQGKEEMRDLINPRQLPLDEPYLGVEAMQIVVSNKA